MSRWCLAARPVEPLAFTITIEEVLADLNRRPAPLDRTTDDPGTTADGPRPARHDPEPSGVPTRPGVRVSSSGAVDPPGHRAA